ncbi:ECF-type sigma factor [Alteromonas oceanisediminis]|uniref:ECF-type sigma factor n=1 Tax=Alteromonas oceanisediminis TaxID=2836180 RepID=UPI001BD99F6F|nr:ECF-type sigma factor [Alteromonas oceanisediminis]
MKLQDNLTEVLNDYHVKSESEKNAVISEVYQLMYQTAVRSLRNRSVAGVTPTLLVNEAFIKLFREPNRWSNREHFHAVVSSAMRQIMVDYARAILSQKRGGDWSAVTYNEEHLGELQSVNNVILVDSYLCKVNQIEPVLVTIIELKFFVGCTNQEVAAATDLSLRTVNRLWDKAKKILERVVEAELS